MSSCPPGRLDTHDDGFSGERRAYGHGGVKTDRPQSAQHRLGVALSEHPRAQLSLAGHHRRHQVGVEVVQGRVMNQLLVPARLAVLLNKAVDLVV
jgi:hypothetical protein